MTYRTRALIEGEMTDYVAAELDQVPGGFTAKLAVAVDPGLIACVRTVRLDGRNDQWLGMVTDIDPEHTTLTVWADPA